MLVSGLRSEYSSPPSIGSSWVGSLVTTQRRTRHPPLISRVACDVFDDTVPRGMDCHYSPKISPILRADQSRQ